MASLIIIQKRKQMEKSRILQVRSLLLLPRLSLWGVELCGPKANVHKRKHPVAKAVPPATLGGMPTIGAMRDGDTHFSLSCWHLAHTPFPVPAFMGVSQSPFKFAPIRCRSGTTTTRSS